MRTCLSKKRQDDKNVRLGCPRNNFFWFEPKQTETQSVSVVFRFVSRNQKTFFSVCFGVSDRYRNNRNKQNFHKTNRKNIQKTFSFKKSSKPWFFFSVWRTETNRNPICFGCFSVCFFTKPNIFFSGLFQCFGLVSKQPKQTEIIVNRGLKRLIF